MVLVRNIPANQCIPVSTPCPQYKHLCVIGEVAGEGAWLAGSPGCQWAYTHGGHIDILSVFLKMSSLEEPQLGPQVHSLAMFRYTGADTEGCRQEEM